MNKLILTDLDNTLVNTKLAHDLAFTCSTNGLSESSLAMAKEKITFMKRLRPNDLTAEHIVLHLQIAMKCENRSYLTAELQDRVNVYNKVFYENLQIMDGAKEVLQKAQEKLIPVIVVSNSYLDGCVKKISEANLHLFVSDIVTPESYGFGKENKFLFKFILEEWCTTADSAIMIGDNALIDGGCCQLGMKYFHIKDGTSSDNFDKVIKFIDSWGK